MASLPRLVHRDDAIRGQFAPGPWFALSEVAKAHNEKNDCAIRAMMIATGATEYIWMRGLFEVKGRKPRHTTKHAVTMAVLETLGHRVLPVLRAKQEQVWTVRRFEDGYRHRTRAWRLVGAPTLATFARRSATGRYLIRVRGHMFALVNGVVIDYKYGPKRKVIEAWKIK